MNLGTLTQFEQSENYVPKYLESSLWGATELRDIDPEEQSDVRAIAWNKISQQDATELRDIAPEEHGETHSLRSTDHCFLEENKRIMQTIAIALLLDLWKFKI